ncbi:hypothetical protein IC235_03420 [Hymenobacter sp. BT664]|uniref:Outer membrane protein beta-barrel domain-containing protein n=1 Tax=Hymenobacter montanus TaxID=2771359 RepID=A0A927BA38_9BACT|nr:hypothetical protein [Hymenobacter montanus]MBD2766940.1 hypothetical protein [Hymenobacter montanus]
MPKSTGSLEELFRHHLGDDATVPPPPLLWDQIDNSLLTSQNETYRRRLAVTRWVAAASLLLATLAGTGWWAHHAADKANELAAGSSGARTSATNAGPAGPARVSNPNTGVSPSSAPLAASRASATSGASSAGATGPAKTAENAMRTPSRSVISATQSSGASPASRTTGVGLAATGSRLGYKHGAEAAGHRASLRGTGSGVLASISSGGTLGTAAAPASRRATPAARPQAIGGQTSHATGLTGNGEPTFGATRVTAAAAGPAASGALPGVISGSPALVASTSAVSATAEPLSLLATKPASLALTGPAPLPNGLAPLALPAEATPAVASATRRWHFGASYTVGAFNPNINFSRVGIEPAYDYNPALGADSPALTEAAAAQYRQHLRPGLSQRLALVARCHLGGHWSLSTGAEVAQATAQSASTAAFVGEQLLDLGSLSTGPLRTTSFRYRTAGIPVEVRYGNPAKRGWSFYGRLGAIISALLDVRSEVADNPEATRTYSLFSAGTPYRRVLGSVRGGAGTQFRPGVGNWAFTLGPVAELGLVPLNAHPVQSYFAQSRPYSFGLEAGVEFGR